MTFEAPPGTVSLVAALAFVAFAVLTWGEWRRPDRRRLPLRLGATLLAVLGLALLGLRPARQTDHRGPSGPGLEASLYTPSLNTRENGQPPRAAGLRFALPTTRTAPPDAVVLPDVAALRRRFPRIGTVHLYGDGLEPFDLDALRGLHVVFHPPDAARQGGPAVTFLYCPRELPLGVPLEIQGEVEGLLPAETGTVTLVSPDGSTADATTSAAGRDGAATFSVRGPGPPASGKFDWRLRLRRGHDVVSDDPLGVAVLRPVLPRVLVLESTPRFDTTALRRWFEQAGGTLAARTQVGKDLYRFFGPASREGSAPREFSTLDRPCLAGFDLVLADGRSLLALKDEERDALHTAVAETGLGVLTLADDAVLPPAPGAEPASAKSPAAILLPWTLRAVNIGEPTPENVDRSVRLRWPGMERPMNTPVEATAWEIEPQAGQLAVVRDEQGRIVAASARLGRGQVALTLVHETGRWNRANDPAAFAAYWSRLFSQVARHDETSGHWSLPGGEAGPVRVDEPLELVWQGATNPPPPPAQIVDMTGEAALLPLIGDPTEPDRWRGTFWPRRPGWHRVVLPGGAPFDFHVDPPGSWPALAAAHRRMVTARFATELMESANGATEKEVTQTAPIASGWWYAMLLLGAGVLWVERRLAAGSSFRLGGSTKPVAA